MYLERLNAPTGKYFKIGGEYNIYPSDSDIQMPNCTLYAMLRGEESVGKKLDIAKSGGGFRNAKYWYGDSPLPKGAEIRNGSIACFDGNYGHVAFVERKIDDTHALISESQYDPDKSLRNYKYWQKRTVELKVGVATLSGVGKLQGFLYLPIKDIRTSLNGTEQVEIIEEMVNIRKEPEGELFDPGCYCPMGIFNVLERSFLNGYNWFKLDKNCWIREGNWLIFHSGNELELLRKENAELKEKLKLIEEICLR